jgi:hypothetical protein
MLDAIHGSVLEPDERALIVLAPKRPTGDRGEREGVAHPLAGPRRLVELARRQDPTVGYQGVIAAASEHDFVRL